jgi:hypothetical protein
MEVSQGADLAEQSSMVSILDTEPNYVTPLANGWMFCFGVELGEKVPIGKRFTCVYSPIGAAETNWRVVMFEQVKDGVMPVKERELTAAEVAHFEGIIGALDDDERQPTG